MNKQELIEKYESFKGIWNNPGSIPALECFLQDLYQLTEPEKPTVPKVALEYYEAYADKLTGFDEWFGDFFDRSFLEEFPRAEELSEWLYDNDIETNRKRELALATLIVNGPSAVKIEPEKLYWVRDKSGMSLLYKTDKGKVVRSSGNNPTLQEDFRKEYTFTEKEIKDYDKRYWAFAIPVEVE